MRSTMIWAAALAAQITLAGNDPSARAQEKPTGAETVPAATIPDREAAAFAKKIEEALPKKGAAPGDLFAAYKRLFKGGKAGPQESATIGEYASESRAAALREGVVQFKSATAKARNGDSILVELGMLMGPKEIPAVQGRIYDLEQTKDGIVIVRERKAGKGKEAGFKALGRDDKAPPPAGGGQAADAPTRPAGPAAEWAFPPERSLGKLQYYDFNANGWKEIGEAKGTVAIPKGTQVTLAASQEGAADLSPLAKLPKDSLHAVLLEGVQVKGEQLASLMGIDSLKKLSLRDAKIADADLAILKDLPTIEELDLGITPIGDEGIKLLQGLAKLQVLDISYTKATNASVDILKQMTNLTYLDPQRTEIKGDKLDELIEALPNCSVVTR